MKFIFITGGLIGFLTASVTDWLMDRGPDRIFFDGAAGCLIGALLLRWFWSVVIRGVRETYVAKQVASEQLEAAKRAQAKSGVNV